MLRVATVTGIQLMVKCYTNRLRTTSFATVTVIMLIMLQFQAEDLLFCYRWLLLELKREFAFDDALHMLEVLWSSLPPDPPQESLPLFEVRDFFNMVPDFLNYPMNVSSVILNLVL